MMEDLASAHIIQMGSHRSGLLVSAFQQLETLRPCLAASGDIGGR
jgi:hypothetical protein